MKPDLRNAIISATLATAAFAPSAQAETVQGKITVLPVYNLHYTSFNGMQKTHNYAVTPKGYIVFGAGNVTPCDKFIDTARSTAVILNSLLGDYKTDPETPADDLYRQRSALDKAAANLDSLRVSIEVCFNTVSDAKIRANARDTLPALRSASSTLNRIRLSLD